MTTAISVIIPCWKDAESLAELLSTFSHLEGVHEIVVADASDDSDARNLSMAARAKYLYCDRPSRGAQMNAGAALASGEVLLFQHADSEMSQRHIDALQRVWSDPAVVGGAFHRRFDSRHPHLRCLERVSRVFNQMGGTLFGDQSIFVRRDHFQRLGGYADIPLMEDVEFSRRLRRSGRVAVLDPPIWSSSRRFVRMGPLRTSIENGLLIVLYQLGVSPFRLHEWYYRGSHAGRGM